MANNFQLGIKSNNNTFGILPPATKLEAFLKSYKDNELKRLEKAGNTQATQQQSLDQASGISSQKSAKEYAESKGIDYIDPSSISIPEKPIISAKKSKSFGEKFENSTFGKHFDGWDLGLLAANQLATAIAGPKSEYSGKKGDLTQGLDSGYDAIQSAVKDFGPVGKAASLAMGANKLLGTVVGKLGGGTDGMTTADAVLGSAFFQMTPLGLINGFGGKTSDTITKDEEAFAKVGGAYGGSSSLVDDSLLFSGKKYGLFSLGAMRDANAMMAEARRLLRMIGDIGLTAQNRFDLQSYMGATAGNALNLSLSGGYNLSAVHVGKKGMVLRAKRIVSALRYQKGKPIQLQRSLEELIDYAKQQNPRFIQRLSEPPKGIDFIDKEGNQTRGSHYMAWNTDENGNGIVFPTIQEINGELKYLDKDAYKTAIKNNNYLKMSPKEAELFAELYKQGWPLFFKEFKEGGSFSILKEVEIDLLPEYKEGGLFSTILNEVEPEYISEFKEGGSFNIIPDGALHARLHHMKNADHLTKKGIPVVDNDNVLQAEIELGEIIFRLEVTKKLEELLKENTDEAAIEAGKLLVDEILHNTIDNTNNII